MKMMMKMSKIKIVILHIVKIYIKKTEYFDI